MYESPLHSTCYPSTPSPLHPFTPPPLPSPFHPLHHPLHPLTLVSEAWTEQAKAATIDQHDDKEDESANVTLPGTRSTTVSPQSNNEEGNCRDSLSDSDSSALSPQQPDKKSFFLTDRQLSRSLNFEDSDVTDHETGMLG